MYRPLRSLALACGLAFSLATAHAQLSPSDVLGAPAFIDYQGKVLDANGAALSPSTPTNYVIEFRIWNDQSASNTASNLVWAESQVATVDVDGTFSVKLGAGTAILNAQSQDIGNVVHANLKGAFNGDQRFLGVTVKISGAGTEVVPRLQFLAAPYALVAQNAVVAQNVNQTTGTAALAQANITAATVNQANITTATVATANLTNATVTGTTSLANATIGTATINAGTFTGNGAGLTNLSGANLAAGSVADTKLTSNVDLLNAAQTVTGVKTFSSPVNLSGSTALQLGASAYHFLAYYGSLAGNTYGGTNIDGPVLGGYNGGLLASTSTSQLPVLRWTGGGNVGIGTVNPSTRLNVSGGDISVNGGNMLVDDGRYFTCRSGDQFAFPDVGGTYCNYGMTANSNNVVLSGFYGLRFSTNANERMRINQNGYVGILTAGGDFPLHVASSGGRNYNGSGGNSGAHFDSDGGGHSFGSGNTSLSIKADSNIEAGSFYAVSDRRIKDVVGLSDIQNDLRAIGQLRVTDYRLIDRLANGDAIHKGFIAQEVQKVFPQVVSTARGFVPDIYARSSGLVFDKVVGSLRVTLVKAHGLHVGDTVRLMFDEDSRDLKVAAVPDERSFVVNEVTTEPKQVFVFGKQVPDFLSVDYNQLFTAGLGAMQELKKEHDTEVARLTKANEALQERLLAQEKHLAELEAKNRERDGKLAAVEKLLQEIASRGDSVAPSVKNVVLAK